MAHEFSDIDMLMDYQKDARLAALGFISMASETIDPKLRTLFLNAAQMAMGSQSRFIETIRSKGQQP